MARKALARLAVLSVAGVLGSGGVALGWNGGGEHNGWDNKPVRGCPSDYELAPASLDPLVDLNGDGLICTKAMDRGFNDIDNIANQ